MKEKILKYFDKGFEKSVSLISVFMTIVLSTFGMTLSEIIENKTIELITMIFTVFILATLTEPFYNFDKLEKKAKRQDTPKNEETTD